MTWGEKGLHLCFVFHRIYSVLPFNHFLGGAGGAVVSMSCACADGTDFAWNAQALVFDWDDQLPSAPGVTGVTGFGEGLWTVKLKPVWLSV